MVVSIVLRIRHGSAEFQRDKSKDGVIYTILLKNPSFASQFKESIEEGEKDASRLLFLHVIMCR